VQLGTASALKAGDVVYTAGFPLQQPGFSFNQGKAIAVVDRRITNDRGGYSIVYDAETLPGMSGGGVFDSNGQLVAIHGQGERYRENTEIDNTFSQVGSKIGWNRGIPVRWLVSNLPGAGIGISGNIPPNGSTTTSSSAAVSADEYSIAGFNKFVEPGDDIVAGKRAAIQELNKAIQLNPRSTVAYFLRAYVYEQIQEFRQSLSDYDRAIALTPQSFTAYNNRGKLKYQKLNDSQGALADWNRAIALEERSANALNPKLATIYSNRGILKYEKLNDNQGALADYDRAIALNPKFVEAYSNRGFLKDEKLNDSQGALADFNRAIALNPKFVEAYINRGLLKYQKLNDIQGALADTNRAIALNPQLAQAYANRGVLKYDKLNDKAGAIQDFRQAAKLFRAQGQTQSLQTIVNVLKELGATE
jgi:tetratricopeptide (TPR) repeat protein